VETAPAWMPYALTAGLWASSPRGNEVIQTGCELYTGMSLPASPVAGMSRAGMGRLRDALASSDPAKQLEARVGTFLLNRGLLTDFGRDVFENGVKKTDFDSETARYVVEVTIGEGGGKTGQVARQTLVSGGKEVILFGENLKKGMVENLRKLGYRVATSWEELEKMVSQ
jgi:hypothetical protein